MTSPTVAERIASLPVAPMHPLPRPDYLPRAERTNRVLLGLECFARHMTDEGHQLQEGLAHAGYQTWGPHFENGEADVNKILAATNPGIVIMQDKREWDATNGACLDHTAGFRNSELLQCDPSIFKLTICKDAHTDSVYHRRASMEIGCHAWIAYYHPDIVHHLAPYTRREHIVRTWHSLNPDHVAPFLPASQRDGCIITGATSDLYPLRQRITQHARELGIFSQRHPGYHARGSHTRVFLNLLNTFKVSVCTASKLGYSLRKLIESTAAGCVVITDLPPDDPLPAIDGNLIRISPDASLDEIAEVVEKAVRGYDEARQREYAERAIQFYDYRVRGSSLAAEIENLRRGYDR